MKILITFFFEIKESKITRGHCNVVWQRHTNNSTSYIRTRHVYLLPDSRPRQSAQVKAIPRCHVIL